MKVRIKYEKKDEVKYVGHLDVMAMFDRVFRRTSIKIQYSQGFHQRSQIVFALPSSVGVISNCEYFEVNIINDFPIENIKDELNKYLPSGFEIIEVIEVDSNTNIVTQVVSACYEFNIISSEYTKIKNLFSNETINVVRTAKNGIKYNMNIVPYIESFEIDRLNENEILINAILKAGSNDNLKPDYIIQAITENNIQISDYQIYKNEVFFI